MRDPSSILLRSTLTDDLAVRDAAKRMNIRPVGSLGIVVRAYNNQLIEIEEAEALLRKLHERSSLFVTSAVVELALRQLQSAQ